MLAKIDVQTILQFYCTMHFRFIYAFLNECKRVITWKLETVKSCAEKRTSHFRKLEKDLDKLEDERKKVNIKFVRNIMHIICLTMLHVICFV